MTIQTHPDYFLVQNVFQGLSGTPEDVYVNNFIFRNTQQPSVESAEGRAMDAVEDFYTVAATAIPGAPTPVTNAILPELISNTVEGWVMKCYDLGNPPGDRIPVVRNNGAAGTDFAVKAGAAYPEEVSVCLSLQTAYSGPWGKGRIFLGPVAAAAGEPGASGQVVTNNIRSRIAAQAAKLALGNGRDMEWCVYSQTKNRMQRVIGGWVDNAFDTQRRRGSAPSHRQNWGTLIPTHSGTTGNPL